MDETRNFYRILFGDLLIEDDHKKYWLTVNGIEKREGLKDKIHTEWIRIDDEENFITATKKYALRFNTYAGLGVRKQKMQEYERGSAEHVNMLPGVWVEVDYGEVGHAAKDLPPTKKDALALVDRFPLNPTLIISSGHGIHAYWLFKEFWEFEPQTEEWEKAKQFLKDFQRTMKNYAAEKGWRIDTTEDLARILRVPGTFNYKDEPVPVETLHSDDSQRYEPDELESYFTDTQVPSTRDTEDNPFKGLPSNFPPSDWLKVQEGCSFMRNAVEEASVLSEPNWYKALTIVARCIDGERDGAEIAHEISAPHPGYSPHETNKKIHHALHDTGPSLCQVIARDTGNVFCKDCKFNGKIKSPINLGMNKGAERLENVLSSDDINEWREPEEISSELLPVKELPPVIIPEPFRAWLEDVSFRMQCPIDFVAVAAMVVSATVIGAGCAIKPKAKDSWEVVPNLWGGIVGRPSQLKSPALAEIMKPLIRLEWEYKDTFDLEMKVFEAEGEVFKAEREAVKGEMAAVAKGKSKSGANMEMLKETLIQMEGADVPTRRRFKTNDTTIEKLGELLNENPRGILVFRDELVGLLCGWEREDRQQDRAFYLEGWNGTNNYTSDRIGRGTIDAKTICISLLGGIQPSKLTGYLIQNTANLANDGMVQRFQLLVYPDEPNWKLVDEWPNTEAKNKAFEALKNLINIDFVAAGATYDDERPFFRFDEEGQVLFYQWLEELEAKIRQEENPLISEHLAKYRSLMPSIALILHLIEVVGGAPPGPVNRNSALKAAAWVEYLESHARRIYGLLGDVGTRSASELAAKIKKRMVHDGFTVRDIYNRKQWHLLDTKELVLEACSELVEAGWVRKETAPVQGRQPKEIYRINPKIFS